jgi:hypothetical protein
VVVKLKERDEDRARKDLATAQTAALAATAALSVARDTAHREERKRGSAAEWLLADSANLRALADVRRAETAARAADEKLGQSRQRYVGARANAEAMRRAADARRSEVVLEAEKAERKAMDEAAVLLFARG